MSKAFAIASSERYIQCHLKKNTDKGHTHTLLEKWTKQVFYFMRATQRASLRDGWNTLRCAFEVFFSPSPFFLLSYLSLSGEIKKCRNCHLELTHRNAFVQYSVLMTYGGKSARDIYAHYSLSNEHNCLLLRRPSDIWPQNLLKHSQDE